MRNCPHTYARTQQSLPSLMDGNCTSILNSIKNDACKCYIENNKNSHLFEDFRYSQIKLNLSIETRKQTYYRISKKLIDPSTRSKIYWSILKPFLNNKKTPLFHENNFITDFKHEPSYSILFLLNSVPK